MNAASAAKGRPRECAWKVAVIVGALLAIPIGLQVRAEFQVRSLCNEVGGLHVEHPIENDAIFVASHAAIFATDDPVAIFAPGRLINGISTAPWSLNVPIEPCIESGLCSGILMSKSKMAYLQFGKTSDEAYLISWLPSPMCRAEDRLRIPAEMIKVRDYYFKPLGRAPNICRASMIAKRSYYVVSSEAPSDPSFNPFSRYLQFRAWRVFRMGEPSAVVEYNQFGVQTLSLKLAWFLSRVFGVPERDYSENRCRVDTYVRSNVSRNTNSHFEADVSYPLGRIVDRGKP